MGFKKFWPKFDDIPRNSPFNNLIFSVDFLYLTYGGYYSYNNKSIALHLPSVAQIEINEYLIICDSSMLPVLYSQNPREE